jgi:hypothetical protein
MRPKQLTIVMTAMPARHSTAQHAIAVNTHHCCYLFTCRIRSMLMHMRMSLHLCMSLQARTCSHTVFTCVCMHVFV